MRNPLALLTSILVATLWLAGCARSPSARFYTLSPIVLDQPQRSIGERSNSVSVGIEPVQIPDYLDRPQIVSLNGHNELKLDEYQRWGGSLGDNVTAVLAENLALLTGSERVLVPPLPHGEKTDYAVGLRILRLDLVPGDQVLLKAQWTVFTGARRAELTTHLATFSERLRDGRYETMVAAVSQTLAQLSREIAREIMGRPTLPETTHGQSGP